MIRNIENERQQINLRAKKAYENIFGKPKDNCYILNN